MGRRQGRRSWVVGHGSVVGRGSCGLWLWVVVMGRGSWVVGRVVDRGSWSSVVGCRRGRRSLCLGSWVVGRGSWVEGRGSWVVGRSLVVGRGSLVEGRGSLVVGSWWVVGRMLGG